MNDPNEDIARIVRIIRLIKLYRQQRSPDAIYLSRDEYLRYYLSSDDWAFWQRIKEEDK